MDMLGGYSESSSSNRYGGGASSAQGMFHK